MTAPKRKTPTRKSKSLFTITVGQADRWKLDVATTLGDTSDDESIIAEIEDMGGEGAFTVWELKPVRVVEVVSEPYLVDLKVETAV